jgi:hypothetical protein
MIGGEVVAKITGAIENDAGQRRLQTTRLPALLPDKIINSIANQFPGKKADWLEKFL